MLTANFLDSVEDIYSPRDSPSRPQRAHRFPDPTSVAAIEVDARHPQIGRSEPKPAHNGTTLAGSRIAPPPRASNPIDPPACRVSLRRGRTAGTLEVP